MSKKEKLIKRIKARPKDFTYDEAEALLFSLGMRKPKTGRTSGSRVRFVHDGTPIIIHKPHPRKELLPYQVDDILDFLERNSLI